MAAARIPVDDFHQLDDVPRSVADDVARRAARRRDQFAIHHQQAMVVAFEERLTITDREISRAAA